MNFDGTSVVFSDRKPYSVESNKNKTRGRGLFINQTGSLLSDRGGGVLWRGLA